MSFSWANFMQRLEQSLDAQSFVWIKGLTYVKYQDAVLYIKTSAEFKKNWIIANYKIHMLQSLQEIDPNAKDIHIDIELDIVDDYHSSTALGSNLDDKLTNDSKCNTKEKSTFANISSQIHANYTFTNFVKGKANNLAYNATYTIAQDFLNTKLVHNPLFIYGGIGLGKTHLMHAMANMLIDNKKHCLYMSASRFAELYILSLKNNSIFDFKNAFHQTDVLLIDDFHILENKIKTQEEFFSLFDYCISQFKLVIIAANKPPFEIVSLKEKMVSRLQGGLVVDIFPPSYELRLNILVHKANLVAVNIPKNILSYLAKNVISDIRALEGAFNKIVFHLLQQHIEKDRLLAQQAKQFNHFDSNTQFNLIHIKELTLNIILSYYNNFHNLANIKQFIDDEIEQYFNINYSKVVIDLSKTIQMTIVNTLKVNTLNKQILLDNIDQSLQHAIIEHCGSLTLSNTQQIMQTMIKHFFVEETKNNHDITYLSDLTYQLLTNYLPDDNQALQQKIKLLIAECIERPTHHTEDSSNINLDQLVTSLIQYMQNTSENLFIDNTYKLLKNLIIEYLMIINQPIAIEDAKEITNYLLTTYINANQEQLDLTQVAQILDIYQKAPTNNTPSINSIKQLVAKHYQLNVNDLNQPIKQKDIVRAKQIIAYVAKQTTDLSLEEIAKQMGYKGHSNVIYAINSIKHKMQTNQTLADDINTLVLQLTK